jgi:hypothetical protein
MVNLPVINTYTPLAWYWTANDGRIYSSAKNALVYVYDSGYQTFISAQGGAKPWPVDASGNQTTASMQAVMTPYGIVLPFT